MLHDTLPVAEIVDGGCAHEFLKEATKLASTVELQEICAMLEKKHEVFSIYLAPEAIGRLDTERLETLLGLMFLLRRKHKALLKHNQSETLCANIGELLHGADPVGRRFQQFIDSLQGIAQPLRLSLASELLHYSAPDKYWLWTHWIWDPKTKGGALPLVLSKEATLGAESVADTYENIGRAISQVTQAGHAEGFTRLGPGPFGTTVFLACVYGVYMYTVFKMRVSGEFNRILPELPEFTRRLLGVYKLQRQVSHV